MKIFNSVPQKQTYNIFRWCSHGVNFELIHMEKINAKRPDRIVNDHLNITFLQF